VNQADRVKHANQSAHWIVQTVNDIDREGGRIFGVLKYNTIRTSLQHSQLEDEELAEVFETEPTVIGLIRWRIGYGRT